MFDGFFSGRYTFLDLKWAKSSEIKVISQSVERNKKFSDNNGHNILELAIF